MFGFLKQISFLAEKIHFKNIVILIAWFSKTKERIYGREKRKPLFILLIISALMNRSLQKWHFSIIFEATTRPRSRGSRRPWWAWPSTCLSSTSWSTSWATRVCQDPETGGSAGTTSWRSVTSWSRPPSQSSPALSPSKVKANLIFH